MNVLGKLVGYKTLYVTLIQQCKPYDLMDLLDLGSNYFLPKFDLEDDFNKVMHGDPSLYKGIDLMLGN